MTQLLVVAAMAVLGWEGVAGQGDRGPENFPVGASESFHSRPLPAPSAGSGIHGGPANAPPPPAPPPSGRCYGGFSVRKATQNSLRSNTRVHFKDVLINMGGWSNSVGDFLAPCTGVYYFSFHAVSSPTSDFTLSLMKNNRYQVTAYGSRSDYQQGSNSALLFLNVGDLVHLQLEQGTIYEHPGQEAYTVFNGHIVEHI